MTQNYQTTFKGNPLKTRVAEYIMDYTEGWYGSQETASFDDLEENDKQEALKEALHDLTYMGTSGGNWGWMIHTSEMLRDLPKYKRDIGTALEEYRDATGESYAYQKPYTSGPEDRTTAEEILSALLLEDWEGEERMEAQMAALLGYRFAVEWYAGELASLWEVEL